MAIIKKSKKTVLWASLLICVLATTLIVMYIKSTRGYTYYDDVAVTKIEVQYNASVIYPTWENEILKINVTVKNKLGDLYYVNVELKVYANETIIGTQSFILVDGYETTEEFEWNFSDLSTGWPYPVYTIKAIATLYSIFFGTVIDTHPEDNELVYGDVTFGWPGDANCDGHVDKTDENIENNSYGKEFPEPGYSASADFNGDGVVNGTDSNIFDEYWYTGPLDGDIVITEIFSVTYPDWDPSDNLTFAVAVLNNGNNTIDFTLTIYNATNELAIGKQNVTLAPQTAEIAKFTLNQSALPEYPDNPENASWPYDTHTIWAEASNASNVEDVYYITRNVTVTVRLGGDANCDGHINLTDVIIVNASHGVKFPDPNYTASVDMNCDGEIDITDIVICGVEFHGGPCDIHDVAVTDIFPVTYPTWDPSGNLTFVVPVQNKGWYYSETFNVTIYNGTDPIDTKTVTDLASRAEKLITFTWEGQQSLPEYPNNSSAVEQYPTHTVWANASKVDGEYDTKDNSCNETVVTVRWPGDANGDYRVNQADLDIVNGTHGSKFPDPDYDPEADMNGDGEIDITDIVICALQLHNGPMDYCDIAVLSVYFISTEPYIYAPPVVYPGWDLEINVYLKNNGDYPETVTLTAYANTTVIGTKTVTLDNGGPPVWKSLTGIIPEIPWEWPYPTYIINVTVTMAHDDNPGNNELENGSVTVWLPGDTNGDGYLNEDDLSTLSGAIDKYDWHADFNGNGEIDLDDVQQLIRSDPEDPLWRQGPRRPDPDP